MLADAWQLSDFAWCRNRERRLLPATAPPTSRDYSFLYLFLWTMYLLNSIFLGSCVGGCVQLAVPRWLCLAVRHISKEKCRMKEFKRTLLCDFFIQTRQLRQHRNHVLLLWCTKSGHEPLAVQKAKRRQTNSTPTWLVVRVMCFFQQYYTCIVFVCVRVCWCASDDVCVTCLRRSISHPTLILMQEDVYPRVQA